MQRAITSVVTLGAFVGALVSSGVARAQEQRPPSKTVAQPPSAAPSTTPPTPNTATPAPPAAQPMEAHPRPGAPQPPARPGATAAAASGQWTYTQQYGWLWVPYDQSDTYVADNSALAYEYVWYPTYGWTWVVAPWVLGLGIAPFWGPLGPVHFAWYAHPWFRMGVGHLHPFWGRGFAPHGWRGGGGFHRR
jgi:hypothetical protein